DRLVIAGLALSIGDPREAPQTYGSFVTSPVALDAEKFGLRIDAPGASAGEAFVIYRHAPSAEKIQDAPWAWDYFDPLGGETRRVTDKYYQFNILTTAEAGQRGWKNPRLISYSGKRQAT